MKRLNREILRGARLVVRKAEDELLKQVIEWGEEDCPHHDERAAQRNYDKKRECPLCWQELKKQLNE